MAIREKSPLLEASESLSEYRKSAEEKRQRKLNEAKEEHDRMERTIYEARENRRAKANSYSEFCNNLKTELLGDAIKGIYIGALMEYTALTDDGLALAESLVDNYIKESGGATCVLRKMGGKTFVLDEMKSIVENTYNSILEDVDSEDPESQDVPEEKKSEMYDDLSQEDDIENAVQTIAQRITDAEEEFIKKNNEDKKTLEDIANKFSERIKAVEDETDGEVATADSDEEAEDAKEEGEETVAQESRIAKRKASNLKHNKVRSVFEQVVLNLTDSIVRDESLREDYTDEDGKLDVGSVVESAKCIYGLLETVNSLQLNRVDAKYIEEALSTM